MAILSQEQALALAKAHVDEIADSVGDKFDVAVEKIIESDFGWIFFYNSKEFIETGNPISSLVGNGPIFVKHDGTVHDLPSATGWEVAIQGIN